MKKLLLGSAIFVILSGCKTTPATDVVDYRQVSVPSLNLVTSATLGSRLLMQAEGGYAETITVSGFEGLAASIPKDTVFFRVADNRFKSVKEKSVVISGRKMPNHETIEYNPQDNEICLGFMICYDNTEINFKYSPEKSLRLKPNSFQQVIEYNGKSGDTLKFTYREFDDDMARSSFTTDFTMDLNEGNQIGYKGAIIEVINATNSIIKYKVLSNFN